MRIKQIMQCLDIMCSIFCQRYEIYRAKFLLKSKDPIFCFSLQLDQLAVDAAKEKRDMEQKHSTIQQKVLQRM